MQPLHTFSGILEAWQRAGGTERSQLRSDLLKAGWLSAIRHAVAERQVGEIERWLSAEGRRAEVLAHAGGLNDFFRQQMRAYLLCARAALGDTPEEVDDWLRAASHETGLPTAFYRDLRALLLGKQLPSSTSQRQAIGVILVEDGHTGVVGELVLERIGRGTGALYPSPAEGFLARDTAFQVAEQAARRYARDALRRWRDDSDVRWSLRGVSGRLELRDGSLGGAMAAGLSLLFSRPSDLSRFILTATVDDEGYLGPVGDWKTKAEGIHNARGRIQGVVVASGQWTADGEPAVVALRRARSVEEALGHLQALDRSQQLRRVKTRFFTVAPLGLLFLSVLLIVHQYTYRFSLKGGGRVVLEPGIRLPYLDRGEIDTGYVYTDFLADRLRGCMRRD